MWAHIAFKEYSWYLVQLIKQRGKSLSLLCLDPCPPTRLWNLSKVPAIRRVVFFCTPQKKILNNVAGLLTAETSASATEFVTILEVNFSFKLHRVYITTSEVPNNKESRKEQNKLKVTLFTIKLKRSIAFRFETTLTFWTLCFIFWSEAWNQA